MTYTKAQALQAAREKRAEILYDLERAAWRLNKHAEELTAIDEDIKKLEGDDAN